MNKRIGMLAAAGLLLPVLAMGQSFNILGKSEKDSGFVLLFDGAGIDGKVFKQWYPFRSDLRRQYYFVENGTLAKKGNQSNNDLMIDSVYGDFVFKFEFRVPKGGNTGVHYRAYLTDWASAGGIEYQVLDQPQAVDNSTGAAYGLYAPTPYPWKSDQWNTGKLVVNGSKVQHYLNDVKVVDYDMDSEDYRRRLASSRFGQFTGKDPVDNSAVKFGQNRRGYLVIQDYGLNDHSWWRNLKLARLPIPAPTGVRSAAPSNAGNTSRARVRRGRLQVFAPGAGPHGIHLLDAAGRLCAPASPESGNR